MTKKKGRGYGPTVIRGEIQYLSASSIAKGDPKQFGGCPKAWYYKYVERIKEPFTAAIQLGKETHQSIEMHLKGEGTLNRLAIHASHLIPAPDASFLVEHSIQGVNYDESGKFLAFAHDAVLTTNEIRVVGEIDLVIPHDKIPSVRDWKTTGNIDRNAKKAFQLMEGIQMPLYGNWAAAFYPEVEAVDLSHVYMQTKGVQKSSLVETRVSKEALEKRWEEIGSISKSLIDIAKEKNAKSVPGNKYACKAWGRPCTHSEYCDRPQLRSLSEIFGEVKIKAEKKRKGKENMDILDQLKKVTPDECAKAPIKKLPTKVVVPANFADVVEAIKKKKGSDGKLIGTPNLVGKEALAWCQVENMDLVDEIKGKGGVLCTLPNPLEFVQLYTIAAMAYTPLDESIMPDIMPPNTPELKPETAAKLITDSPLSEQKTLAELSVLERAKNCASTGNFGAMKKADIAKAFTELYSKDLSSPDPILLVNPTVEGSRLYINAIPSEPFDHLDRYIEGCCKALAEMVGAKDIRTSDHKALSFGKWKGALSAYVRENPPEEGVYYIDTGSEIYQEVANTLIESAKLYVKGT